MRQVKQRLRRREVFACANVKRSVPLTSADTSRCEASLHCISNFTCRQAHFTSRKKKDIRLDVLLFSGAGDEARTRYLHLGKVALYRMSYTRIWGLFPRNMMHYSAGVPICQPLFSSFFKFILRPHPRRDMLPDPTRSRPSCRRSGARSSGKPADPNGTTRRPSSPDSTTGSPRSGYR